MVVLCLMAALSGLSQAETTKGSSSSKTGATSKAKAKTKAKSAASDDDSDAPKAVKPKTKATPSEDDADGPKTAKPKVKSAASQDESADASKAKAKAKTKDSEDDDIDEPRKKEAPRPAAVTSINVDELAGFDNYPRQVRSLVESAVALTHLGLTYTYGSSEPNQGGMDCSGTMYHVLRFQGLKDVPRQSDEMCAWVRDHTRLHLTPTASEFSDVEFAALRPGDLLFWTGTAETSRKLPVTHVMLYLGKLKSNGKRVVFGSSDGRSYEGNRRCGVSVFDFSLPKTGGKAAFYGYGPAPGLATPEALALEEIRKAEVPVAPVTKPLVDGEKLYAAKSTDADQPLPLPQAEESPPAKNKDAAAGSEGEKPSVAASKPETKESDAKTGSQTSKKLAAAKSADSEPKRPATIASAAKSLTAKNQGENDDRPSSKAKGKGTTSTAASKATASTPATARKSESSVKNGTSGAVAQRTPAKNRPAPEDTESKPAKAVREVVDTIRNAFK